MHVSTATTDPRGALCAPDGAAPRSASPAASASSASAAGPRVEPIFPPRDADTEARRRWLASSPWPEVVFACAL